MLWYALPLLAVGAWIFNAVSESEKEAERRWQEKKAEVKKTVTEHRQHIEQHIQEVQNSYDYYFLVDMHYSSVQVANMAYKLLGDARESLNGIGKMLKNCKQRKNILEKDLQNAKRQKDKTEIKRIIEELKTIKELREGLFLERDKLIAQKNSFYTEVQQLNAQTSQLKYFIRDRCGHRGIAWYNRLEARKLHR